MTKTFWDSNYDKNNNDFVDSFNHENSERYQSTNGKNDGIEHALESI